MLAEIVVEQMDDRLEDRMIWGHKIYDLKQLFESMECWNEHLRLRMESRLEAKR